MHEPMGAPLVGAVQQQHQQQRSSSLPTANQTTLSSGHQHQQQQPRPSQSPGYHSAASSPSSSSSPPSISSPLSTVAGSLGASSSSAISSSRFSPPAQSSPPANCHRQQSPAARSPIESGHQASTPNRATMRESLQSHECQSGQLGPSSKSTSAHNNSNNKTATQRAAQQHSANQRLQANQSGPANMCSSLFDHFPELDYDGALLTWFHGANSRASLSSAIMSNKMFVAGDISLAEMSRYPVPIMARPPLGVSDLTLENWLADMTRTQKGIKLTFTSTRTVEPAFRVLARHAPHIKGPLILSADILTKPTSGGQQQSGAGNKPKQQQQQQQQPVDAWTFLMLCRTRFPRSIISIGWCSGQPSLALPSASSPPSSQLETGPFGSSVDSMFELDIEGQHQLQMAAVATNGPSQCHQVEPAVQVGLDLAASSAVHQQQAALIQQLAVQAAAQAHHLLPPGAMGHQQQQRGAPSANISMQHHFHSQHNHFNHQNQRNPHHHNQHHHHQHKHHHHHHHLSSSGSLSSNSSGNSSGSPSPTSPLSHHLMHHHRSYHQESESPESSHQFLLAAAAAAAVSQHNELKPNIEPNVDWSTAMAAAAMVAASSMHQQQQDNQLPLNLNINEADPKHATSALNDLAHRIQSMNRQQRISTAHILTTTPANGSTILNINKIQHHQQKTLSNKLASSGGVAKLTNLSQSNLDLNDWQHINKKAAITSSVNSNSPSPISTSPKQQQQLLKQSANLLCVSKQQQQAVKQEATYAATSGYTREMIDKMASLVKEYNLTQPITFPVEARLLLRNNDSLNELQRLLYQVGSNSTLTIVAQPEDLIGVDDLLQMRKHFSPQQILFDLPDGLALALKQEI